MPDAPVPLNEEVFSEVTALNASGDTIFHDYLSATSNVEIDTTGWKTLIVAGGAVRLSREGEMEYDQTYPAGSHPVIIGGSISAISLGFVERGMSLRWFDDRQRWSKERAIDLGQAGDMFPTVRLFRLGVYRSRQWEFVFPANVVQCLAVVEEDAEVLR